MFNQYIKNNIPKINGFVRKSFRKKSENTLVCALHYHDELECIAIHEGELTAVVDNVSYHAKKGDVIFINSGVPHATYSETDQTSSLIQIKESNFINSELSRTVKYSAKLSSLAETKAKVINSPELFSIIDEITTENEKKLPSYEVYIKGGIYKLLGCLCRMGILQDASTVYNTKEAKKIIPVLDYVNKNYNEEIALETVCAMLSFAPSYFCRIFKSATGATFTEYLNFVRICRAEKLLNETELSILEISESVGFSSVSYFNRIFKRYRSCSPSCYRSALYANM